MEALHPPLTRFMVAVLPYCFAGLRLAHGFDLWGYGMWGTRDLSFYWRSLALARAGNLLFAAVLFLFVYRWSSELYGRWAALTACALVACCPTVLGHAGLATTDIGGAATVVAAAYFFWCWAEQPGWGRAIAAALAFGLAALAKFSALVFLPPMAVLYFLPARGTQKGFTRAAALQRAAVFGCVFALTIWAGYLFRVGIATPAGHQYATPFYSEQGSPARRLWYKVIDKKLPAQMFFLGLIEVLDHNEGGQTNYLLGHVSRAGHWHYFPVALATKSTLPLLLLAVLGIAAAQCWR
jgi:4-amino-4-deoxy-L-arabinose transferase-like glycosyltransferase